MTDSQSSEMSGHSHKPGPVTVPDTRLVRVMRVATIHSDGCTDLCLVRSVAACGLAMRVYRKMTAGDQVEVELKPGQLLRGQVSWTREFEIGVGFEQPIDIDELLSSRWSGEEGCRPRLPRLELNCPAIMRRGARTMGLRVHNLSPGGAQVRTRDALRVGEQVVLTLPDLPALHGAVRWCKDGAGGIAFNERIPLAVLGRWFENRRSMRRSTESAGTPSSALPAGDPALKERRR